MSRLAASTGRATHVNWRVTAWSIAAGVVLVFVLANAHLAYVAFVSQPDCVAQQGAHSAGGATYRAASPAC